MIMLTDYTIQFFVVMATGAAVGLAGIVNLLTPRLSGVGRIATTVAVAAVPVAGLALIQTDNRVTLLVAGITASFLLLVGLMGSKSLAAAIGHRTVRWVGLTAFGILACIASGIRYDRALEADSNEGLEELAKDEYRPPLEYTPSPAVTDHGHAVLVQHPLAFRTHEDTDEHKLRNSNLLLSAIRLTPADETCNCHGWVFAGGKYWIGGSQVDQILDENGYHSVSTPKVGDLVIYRASNGDVTHSAVVTATPEGLPALLESKWGCLGVFIHPMNKSPYGTDFTIYHSNRTGHVLAGLSNLGIPMKITLP